MNDYLLTGDMDLKIENGDFAVGDPTLQNQQIILKAQKGEIKEYPELGVGVDNEVFAENHNKLLIEIKRNFKYDGMKVKQLGYLDNGKLFVNAVYPDEPLNR